MDGAWKKVSYTYAESGLARLYVDGMVVTEGYLDVGAFGEVGGFTVMEMGRRRGSVPLFYEGYLDDVRVYAAALGPEAVLALGKRQDGGGRGAGERRVQHSGWRSEV